MRDVGQFTETFFFLATPTAYGHPWARDQTHTTTVTLATAVTTPDP